MRRPTVKCLHGIVNPAGFYEPETDLGAQILFRITPEGEMFLGEEVTEATKALCDAVDQAQPGRLHWNRPAS